MNNLFKVAKFLVLINLLTSCQFNDGFKMPSLNDIKVRDSKSQIKKKEKLEIRISCGDGNLKELLDKGWQIKNSYTEEKVCSWKSVPANKKCDMERDKGCKITKPDVIGKEIYYLLEK
tara:strand:+ start:20845 stop:21198 length:354 start_codon:yes stop_codon:yes gene_type:complete